MYHATVNGVRLAYAERGRRHDTTLILIHGFPLDRHLWDAQLAGLASSAHVLAPDLRGHGGSEIAPGPYSMDGHADDIAALLDHLGIQKAIVAGLSMGGYIAFAFWRRYPERVRALALLDTRADPDSPEARANRDASVTRVKSCGAEAFAGDMLPRLLSPASQADARLAGRALAQMAAQPVPGIVADLLALRDRPDSRPTLPSITVPVLVVAGEADQLTPPSVAHGMAQAMPDARVAIIPGAGHLSPLENPRAVNAALRRFIASLGHSSGSSGSSGHSISSSAAR